MANVLPSWYIYDTFIDTYIWNVNKYFQVYFVLNELKSEMVQIMFFFPFQTGTDHSVRIDLKGTELVALEHLGLLLNSW